MNAALRVTSRPGGGALLLPALAAPRRLAGLPGRARPSPVRRERQITLAGRWSPSDSEAEALVVAQRAPAASPFLESFLRGALLGMGCAIVLETGHTLIQLLTLALDGSLALDTRVFDILRQRFEPLFLADHVTAIGGWLLFYALDAVAVAAALRCAAGDAVCANDGAAAGRVARSVVALPRHMLPLELTGLTRLLATPGPGAAEAAAAPAPPPKPDARPAPPMARGEAEGNIVPGPGALVLPPPPAATPRKQRAAQDGGALVDRRSRKGLRQGEWDPAASPHARRVRELAGRAAYLSGFWYAAALSSDVGQHPVAAEVCGRRLALFRRSDGAVAALDDACPHRGAPLSGGWVGKVEGRDCVVCPYHGWAFDSEGRLRDVPASAGKGEWPQRRLVSAPPVAEAGGFVWLFYGPPGLPEEERPPIPATQVPELADPSWKAVYGQIEFDCNHHAVFENAIDMAHIHYLHSDSFGNQGQPQIRDMQCTTDQWGVTATFGLHNKPASPLWEWTKVPEVRVTAKAFLPSSSVISFTLGSGLSFSTFVNVVPVGPHKTVNRFALVRNLAWDRSGLFNADAWDAWARNAMLRILEEDKAMVEQLRPEALAQEYSVRADLPQVEFRKLRQQFIDLGYGVAPEPEHGRAPSDL